MSRVPLHRAALRNPDAAYRKSGDGSVIEFYTRRPSLWRRLGRGISALCVAVWRWL